MRLTAYTDYTLRTLIYLAVNDDRYATIGEIAQAYGISETHLMKIVHRLGVAGDIQTVRGRKGGIRLGKPASDIKLGDVVRRTEPDMELVTCFEATGMCAIGEACVLRSALNEALVAFLTVLDRYSLADLAAPRRQLATLLGIAPASYAVEQHPTKRDDPADIDAHKTRARAEAVCLSARVALQRNR